MIISENWCQFLVPNRSYVLERTSIEIALNSTKCKWAYPMNRTIDCESGSSFMGHTVNAGIAPGMRNVLPFLIRDAKSCIDCQRVRAFVFTTCVHRPSKHFVTRGGGGGGARRLVPWITVIAHKWQTIFHFWLGSRWGGGCTFSGLW